MENYKWFEKWYSKHVIEHYKQGIFVKIENKNDLGWIFSIDFSASDYKHLKEMYEIKKISDYNYFEVKGKSKVFHAEGDFTKLDFLIGKFRTYIGETDTQSRENDLFLNPDIQNFIFENYSDSYVFLHYTHEQEIVETILKNGFEYSNAFDKTTCLIHKDLIDINYNHLLRKPFGNFVVLICIEKNLYAKYNELAIKNGKHELKAEELLSEKEPYINEFDEKTYTLHHKYIKGYINWASGKIVKNPDYNYRFDSDFFKLFI